MATIMSQGSSSMRLLALVALLVLVVDTSDALQVASSSPKRATASPRKPFAFYNDLPKTSPSPLFQASNVVDSPSRSSALLAVVLAQSRSLLRDTQGALQTGSNSLLKLAAKSWWCAPMMLALVPLYSALVFNKSATMPTWWALTSCKHILSSKHAAIILTFFLSSNICYFISGTYLMMRFSKLRTSCKKKFQGFPLLGMFMLAAGVVSTVFHYFQALGSFHVAEALCYIDHGIACTGILYFWHKCGKPGLIASVLSGVGFATLIMTGPGYAWLHSAWHGLSSVAAIFWAQDGVNRLVSIDTSTSSSSRLTSMSSNSAGVIM